MRFLAGLLGMQGFFEHFKITFDPSGLCCELDLCIECEDRCKCADKRNITMTGGGLREAGAFSISVCVFNIAECHTLPRSEARLIFTVSR